MSPFGARLGEEHSPIPKKKTSALYSSYNHGVYILRRHVRAMNSRRRAMPTIGL